MIMKSSILWVFVVACANRFVMATLLAGAGYLASSPGVRDILIRSGIAQEVHHQGQILYDLSGFRFVGFQGNDKKEATLLSHDLVEISAEEVPRPQILKRMKRDYPFHEERKYLERIFGLLHNMDGNTCISRLVCEIGQDHKPFGIIGRQVAHYLGSLPPVTWNSATYEYLDAFNIGKEHGKQQCREYFNTCAYDLRRVMGFLWLVVRYPLHL